MIKHFGLGVACLLVVSGITNAGMIVNKCEKHDDYGKKGHEVTFKCEDKHYFAENCKDIKLDLKDLQSDFKDLEKDLKNPEKNSKDIKMDLKDLKKDLKDLKHDEKLCDIRKGHDDRDCKPECGPVRECGRNEGGACSVPLPASSAMGGIGAGIVALMSWVRARRASIA